MARFRITNERQFERFLDQEIQKRMNEIIRRSDDFLFKQAELLRDRFESSNEFRDLSGRLVGEFGFTPEEVRNLSQILTLLVPRSNDVTTLKITQRGGVSLALLEWVDFDKLKEHPFAQHDLTRLNPRTGQFELTERISWVDWLENGAVVRGYNFERVSGNSPAREFSRSGQGIMRLSRSGFWQFQPTKVFENIGKTFSRSEFRRGFGVVLRRTRTR